MNQYGFNYFNFIFTTFIHKFKVFKFDVVIKIKSVLTNITIGGTFPPSILQ